ncbi:MAG: HEAT repeat domain-containing protein, partial [Balneolaceae bacterium]
AGQLLQIKEGASSKEVAALNHEIQRMKQTLMYGGSYSQVSAGERLSAINLSTKIPSGDKRLGQEITDILIHTMNSDKSVNVRMAAAEALFRFRDEPGIKKALVNSLSEQEDPQMQITLIDMLVQMKAKGALNEMNKLLMNTNTRDVVKQQLKAGIAELRT